LSNVVQHAQAKQAVIKLYYEGHQIRLVIADDGHGIDMPVVNGNRREGRGIANMMARARLLGGDLAVRSDPGEGTEVIVLVPCVWGGEADE